jgi:hypothetical protein
MDHRPNKVIRQVPDNRQGTVDARSLILSAADRRMVVRGAAGKELVGCDSRRSSMNLALRPADKVEDVRLSQGKLNIAQFACPIGARFDYQTARVAGVAQPN